jgi:hypothetical protein
MLRHARERREPVEHLQIRKPGRQKVLQDPVAVGFKALHPLAILAGF